MIFCRSFTWMARLSAVKRIQSSTISSPIRNSAPINIVHNVDDSNDDSILNKQQQIDSLDQYKFNTPVKHTHIVATQPNNKKRRIEPVSETSSSVDVKNTVDITDTDVTVIDTPIKQTKTNKKNNNQVLIGLAPIVPVHSTDTPPRILILGSMPSAASLMQQQYYAYKYNHFWPVLSKLLKTDLTQLSYNNRTNIVRQHGIAIWDTVKQCVRPGSLDSDISNALINDFYTLFIQYPTIQRILCNGNTSYTLFKRYVANTNTDTGRLIAQRNIEIYYVPSTSPAHAVKNAVDVKADKWRMAMYGEGQT